MKLDEHALAIEGIMAMMMGILHCIDTKTTLSIIATLSRDQACVSKLKDDLEKEKKLNSEL